MKQQSEEKKNYAEGSSTFHLRHQDLNYGVAFVTSAYMFSPYAIASCVGKTTTVFVNFLLSTSLVCLVKGNFQ